MVATPTQRKTLYRFHGAISNVTRTAILRAVMRSTQRWPAPRIALTIAAALALLGSACHRTTTPLAQPPAAVQAASTLAPPLTGAVAELHTAIEAERIRAGTPAAALLIVQDDAIVLAEGYGFRNGRDGGKVDAKTQFAIGSTTKAFTAMLVMQAVEAGVLKLSDSPRQCLPDFELADPEANDKITIRDLLTHRSGLGRTDMAWYASVLSRDELLQVATAAQPIAPLGQQVHYQNLMYLAAGLCAANALEGEYEALVRTRIFEPLAMHDASLDAASLAAAPNHAQGHARVGDDRRAVAVPVKNIDAIAPAGSINANLESLAPWLRLMLGGGQVEQTRLVSEESFARLVAPHVTMGPGVQYGLGWVVDRWHGKRRVWHNGGIDGYYALISMLPDEGIGFVLLTADDSAAMQEAVTDGVFALAVSPQTEEDDAAAQGANAAHLDGTYGIIGGFQAVVSTDATSKQTTLTVQGQSPYPLRAVDENSFTLGAPAPEGFAAKFSGPNDARVLTIVQPQGPIPLPWLDPQVLAQARSATLDADQRALLAGYHDETTGVSVRLVQSEGRVALVAGGQAPAPLVATGPDTFGLDGLPNAFAVTIVRKRGTVTGLQLAQPQGAVTLSRVPGSEPVQLDVQQVLRRAAKAHGVAALTKHSSMEVHSRLQFVHQGVTGRAETRRAPGNRFAETLTLEAVGKTLGTIWVGHNGTTAWERSTLSPVEDLTTAKIQALALQAMLDPLGRDSTAWTERAVDGVDVLPGVDEPVVLITRRSAEGITWTDAFGRKSHLLLQRTTSVPSPGTQPPTVETQRFDDYREVGGVMLPHRVEATTANGVVISTVESVHFDATLPKDAFAPPAP